MKINKIGATRLVFIFHTFVVKVPNPTFSWYNFVCGLISNMNERDSYRFNSGRYYTWKCNLLCPILWASWGGWIVVMQRARILTDQEYKSANLKFHIEHFPGDEKAGNYGYIDGRIVKVDYGS